MTTISRGRVYKNPPEFMQEAHRIHYQPSDMVGNHGAQCNPHRRHERDALAVTATHISNHQNQEGPCRRFSRLCKLLLWSSAWQFKIYCKAMLKDEQARCFDQILLYFSNDDFLPNHKDRAPPSPAIFISPVDPSSWQKCRLSCIGSFLWN